MTRVKMNLKDVFLLLSRPIPAGNCRNPFRRCFDPREELRDLDVGTNTVCERCTLTPLAPRTRLKGALFGRCPHLADSNQFSPSDQQPAQAEFKASVKLR